nr:hypothetical protein [Providencia sp. PROV021]
MQRIWRYVWVNHEWFPRAISCPHFYRRGSNALLRYPFGTSDVKADIECRQSRAQRVGQWACGGTVLCWSDEPKTVFRLCGGVPCVPGTFGPCASGRIRDGHHYQRDTFCMEMPPHHPAHWERAYPAKRSPPSSLRQEADKATRQPSLPRGPVLANEK